MIKALNWKEKLCFAKNKNKFNCLHMFHKQNSLIFLITHIFDLRKRTAILSGICAQYVVLKDIYIYVYVCVTSICITVRISLCCQSKKSNINWHTTLVVYYLIALLLSGKMIFMYMKANACAYKYFKCSRCILKWIAVLFVNFKVVEIGVANRTSHRLESPLVDCVWLDSLRFSLNAYRINYNSYSNKLSLFALQLDHFVFANTYK